jgi:hypothetical protein
VRGTQQGLISSRSDSTVGSIKLEGHREVLGDERVVIMASKPVNISHHTRRAMEYLKEVTKKFLGPSTNLMDRPIIFKDFLDGVAVAVPKGFSTPEKFAVLTDGPATATSLSDEGMIIALTFITAARAESNRMEASAIHGNVEVADAFRAE